MHAAPDIFGGRHLEMRLQFFAEIGIGTISGEEADDARERGT
jgi:hypothetical protein